MPSLLLRRPTSAARCPRFCTLLVLLSLGFGFACPASAGEDSLPPKTLAALKAATVFLKVEDGRDAGSGIGEGPRVAITGGRTERRVGQPHTFFQINYRFVQGAPAAGMRYGWVIVTARGRSYKQSLAPGTLHQQGRLQGQAPIGISQLDRPYRTYLVIELPGLQEEKISDELILR